MKTLATILLALSFASPVAAQTKINLGTQTQGQLPVPSAQGVLNLAQTVSHGGGSLPGTQAMPGYEETFQPEEYCVNGSMPGWQNQLNTTCGNGFYTHTSAGTLYLDRNFYFGGTNAYPPAPTHFAIGFTAVGFNNAQASAVGINTCNLSDWACAQGGTKSFDFVYASPGLQTWVNGTATTVFPAGGITNPAHGTTDSGYLDPSQGSTVGNPAQGWAGYATSLYDAYFGMPGDGTVIMSTMPFGDLICNQWCSSSIRIPAAPSGTIHQLELRLGTDTDYVSNLSAADGGATPVSSVIYDIPHTGSKMLRWAIHPDGTESTYNGDCATTATSNVQANCMNVYAWVPSTYDPKVANPWVFHFAGRENEIISLYSTFDGATATYSGVNYPNGVANAIFHSGYVIVGIDFNLNLNGCGTCHYGSPQNVADVAHAIAKVKQALNLAADPYVIADSMGGVAMYSAITHGAIKPKAIWCASCNMSTIFDYNGTGGVSNQAGNIQGSYGFSTTPAALCVNSTTGVSTCSSIAGATNYANTPLAGYDALAIAEHPLTAQATTGAYPLLLPNAAQVLASIPLEATCDPSDNTVGCAANSQQLVNDLNALNPVHSFVPGIGGHVGPPLFNATAVLNWFSSHP